MIATASTTKLELARSAGAQTVIDYTAEDFVAAVRKVAPAGVDVVYDSVGRDTFEAGLGCLRPRGTMVLYGQSSGAAEPLDPQVLNHRGSLYLTRPTLAHYVASRPELLGRAADVFAWVAAGELEVRIDRKWPLADAAEAHRHLEARRSTGKLLLIP